MVGPGWGGPRHAGPCSAEVPTTATAPMPAHLSSFPVPSFPGPEGPREVVGKLHPHGEPRPIPHDSSPTPSAINPGAAMILDNHSQENTSLFHLWHWRKEGGVSVDSYEPAFLLPSSR